MFIEIIVGLVAALSGFIYIAVSFLVDDQPLICSNCRFASREMRNKVLPKNIWEEEKTKTSIHDVELTFNSFKRFVDLNPEGWSWNNGYGIYSYSPRFQPFPEEYYCIRFKTYKDYVKAAAYWHNLGEMKSKRKQELVEAKNTAKFLTIQKQRAKDAEEQAARKMRESEEQILEILERLKNESVVPTLTPPSPSASVSITDKGKTVTLSGSPDMYGWKV